MNTLWSERVRNHVIVFWRGQPIYKSYDGPGHPSVLLNRGWPGAVWLTPHRRDR